MYMIDVKLDLERLILVQRTLFVHITSRIHQNCDRIFPYFWSKCVRKCVFVCDALTFLLDNIFIRFGTKLYRQVHVVGIPMGTNCAPLVADLFLFFL